MLTTITLVWYWAAHAQLLVLVLNVPEDAIWLHQFATSSATLNTVESHCLLYIPCKQ